MRIRQWQMTAVGEPLRLVEHEASPLGPGQARVRVAGCGVCHTDLGFYYDGVKTRHALPLTLGHEVSGVVEELAPDVARDLAGLAGEAVIVPAVLPCGTCRLCLKGRSAICPAQVFPGNDVDGGFASHVVLPARHLVRVPRLAAGHRSLRSLAVLADAVSTPYQAVKRSGLGQGDLAVFVGAGGVGAFGIQIAAALGATVVAIDVDRARLDLVRAHGAAATIDATGLEAKAIKKNVRETARKAGLAETEWKVFETSGTKAGQETAFRLLVPGAHLAVVGFTTETATVPLSHLMAFDAEARGTWGCDPGLYPEVLAMVADGRVLLDPFIEEYPLSAVNDVLAGVHDRKIRRRPVLVPDLD